MTNKIFLYGTLMPGQSRGASIPYQHVIPTSIVMNAVVRAYGLFYYAHGNFPIAVVHHQPALNAMTIKGKLLSIKPERLEEVLEILDEVEGVSSNLFRRLCVDVLTEKPETLDDAWMYAIHPDLIDRVTQFSGIEGGDWETFNTKRVLLRESYLGLDG